MPVSAEGTGCAWAELGPERRRDPVPGPALPPAGGSGVLVLSRLGSFTCAEGPRGRAAQGGCGGRTVSGAAAPTLQVLGRDPVRFLAFPPVAAEGLSVAPEKASLLPPLSSSATPPSGCALDRWNGQPLPLHWTLPISF